MEIDVKKIARLSRLKLGEEQAGLFQRQMEEMIRMVENLPEMDKLEEPLDPKKAMSLRRDEIAPSLKRDAILKNAPQSEAGCFVVPKVVE